MSRRSLSPRPVPSNLINPSRGPPPQNGFRLAHLLLRIRAISGIPTKIEWILPPGFKASEIQCLQPEKIVLSGLTNYGYEKDVLLPVEITPPPSLKHGTPLSSKPTPNGSCAAGKLHSRRSNFILTIPWIQWQSAQLCLARSHPERKNIVPHPAPSADVEHTSQSIGFLVSVVSAFVGGLILNLMPCVLPVLALKVLALVKAPTRKSARLASRHCHIRGHYCFLLGFATILLILRAATPLGWGFQMQSPPFVAFLAALFLLLALNLFGVLNRRFLVALMQRRRGLAVSGALSPRARWPLLPQHPAPLPTWGLPSGFALTQPPGATSPFSPPWDLAWPRLILFSASSRSSQIHSQARQLDDRFKQFLVSLSWVPSFIPSPFRFPLWHPGHYFPSGRTRIPRSRFMDLRPLVPVPPSPLFGRLRRHSPVPYHRRYVDD